VLFLRPDFTCFREIFNLKEYSFSSDGNFLCSELSFILKIAAVMNETIATERLSLIPCDHTLVGIILSDFDNLGILLKVRVPENWPIFPEAFRHAYDIVKTNPDEQIWWTYLFIDPKEEVIVGSGGFKGPPKNGSVEIGYEVAPEFRNRGYATEAAMGFMTKAFQNPTVKKVLASTLPMPNASNRVLEKCGMEFIESKEDDEIGEVWYYEVTRDAFLAGR